MSIKCYVVVKLIKGRRRTPHKRRFNDVLNDGARIGKVLIKEEMRGQGLGEQIVRKAYEFAFNELQCHKVSLGVFDFNKGAFHCYEKVGFQTEGILSDARKNGGLLKPELE